MSVCVYVILIFFLFSSDKLKTFKSTFVAIFEGLVKALVTGKSGTEMSSRNVAKRLFPGGSSSDVKGFPSRDRSKIVEAWIVKCLITNDPVFDVSLALVSQPDIGRHLNCVTAWKGECVVVHHFKHICIHVCTLTYVGTYMITALKSMYSCVHGYTCVLMYLCLAALANMCTYIRTYILVYMYICMYIHLYTYSYEQ